MTLDSHRALQKLNEDQIAKYIARRATLLGWFDAPDADSDTTCFALKQPDGNYAYEPCIISSDLGAAIAILGENAIISMASEVTMAVVNTIEPGQVTLVVESTGARVPVVQSLSDVKRTLTQFSSSCIVLKEKCVLIWSHDPRTIINVAHNVEKQMLGYVSRRRLSNHYRDTADSRGSPGCRSGSSY